MVCPVRSRPFSYVEYRVITPQQQPEQQPNVRWAHGRESMIHS